MCCLSHCWCSLLFCNLFVCVLESPSISVSCLPVFSRYLVSPSTDVPGFMLLTTLGCWALGMQHRTTKAPAHQGGVQRSAPWRTGSQARGVGAGRGEVSAVCAGWTSCLRDESRGHQGAASAKSLGLELSVRAEEAGHSRRFSGGSQGGLVELQTLVQTGAVF